MASAFDSYRALHAAMDPGKPLREMIARLEGQPYRDIVAALDPGKSLLAMAEQLTAANVAALDPGKSLLAMAEQLTAANVAALDPGKSLQAMLEQLNVNKPYRDMVAALDPGKSLQAMAEQLNVNKPYRDMVAALDPGKSLQAMLAQLDVDQTYREMVAGLTEASLGWEALAGPQLAQSFTDLLGEVDGPPGTSESLVDITEAMALLEDPATPLSEAARLAIASYVGTLAFALCAWFYLARPDEADLILDASTPATWSLAIAMAVYARLGPGGHRD